MALLIYGPTAAGKSACARTLAETLDGEIVNADALQIYRELKILSGQPSDDEMAVIPHHLYGHISVGEAYSVGAWQKQALAAIDAIGQAGRLPIIVGGTGLYFRALTQGLSAIPEIDPAIRAQVRDRLVKQGAAALHRQLGEIDPALAKALPPNDRQRISRGLEVYEATAIPLSQWQQMAPTPPTLSFFKTLLLPENEILDAASDARLDHMLAHAVLDEVAAIQALNLADDQPALKALGFSSFRAHLAGDISQIEALNDAKAATRRYIRRQRTWARTQMTDYFSASNAAELTREIIAHYQGKLHI